MVVGEAISVTGGSGVVVVEVGGGGTGGTGVVLLEGSSSVKVVVSIS